MIADKLFGLMYVKTVLQEIATEIHNINAVKAINNCGLVKAFEY